jgi:hypothetical protein
MDGGSRRRGDCPPDILQALELIYGCLTRPGGFQELPGRLAPLLKARALTIWCCDTDLDAAVAHNAGLDSDAVAAYLEHWIHADPLLDAAVHAHLGTTNTPEGLVGPRAYRELPVFQGFYEPNEIKQ